MARITPPATTAIATAKQAERTASIVLVVDDIEALKVIEAWRTLPHKPFTDPKIKPGQTWIEALSEAWQDVSPDYAAIADIARIPMMVAVAQFIRLKIARLIYPDGSIHDAAKVVLDSYAYSKLKALKEPA